jgi:hypothetical protein
VRFVSRLYKEKQLRLRWRLETTVRRVGQSPANKDVNTEAEKATALEAVAGDNQ